MNITIYDNTLRDGEQQVGISFTTDQKIQIAKQLDRLGVPRIEAGFIAVSDEERESIKSVNECGLKADIFCLARLLKSDIDLALDAGLKHITIFTCASDLLINYKLKTTEDNIMENIKKLISYCKENDMFVRFSCEDATRAPMDRLCRFYNIAYSCGADFASVPDTCGISSPQTITTLIQILKNNVEIPLSIHCHNDLGLATANTLSAMQAGVNEVQLTVNGIGERVGNASFEEVVIDSKLFFDYDFNLDIHKLRDLCCLVSKLSGVKIPNNKPIFGKHAFCHESGLHVQALRNNPHTYEPFPPEMIGLEHSISFGKHSGKSNLDFLLERIGRTLSEVDKEHVLKEIKFRAIEERILSEKSVISIINNVIDETAGLSSRKEK